MIAHQLRSVPVALAALLAVAPTAAAQEDTPAAAPESVLPDAPSGVLSERYDIVMAWLSGGPPPDIEAIFAAEFLEQVPKSQIMAIVPSLRVSQFGGGPVRTVRFEPTALDDTVVAIVVGQNGRHARMTLSIDGNGRLDGVLFRPAPEFDADTPRTWQAVSDRVSNWDGTGSLGVYRLDDGGPTELLAVNEDERLAIGSAFKLWVLLALAEKIEAGEADWADTIPIRPEAKSLPSGTMQNLEDGTERDLATFAELMISISDNTATDHLIDFVGRERVEEVMARMHGAPERNRPFLKTREMFTVKFPPEPDPGLGLRERYLAAGEDERRRMLEEEVPGLEVHLPAVMVWTTAKKPVEIDTLEWFATPLELARVMAALDAMCRKDGMAPLAQALTRNPGVSIPSSFSFVGYKGGSEPGVLNMTWLLRTDAEQGDRVYCLTMSWNNHEKDADLNEMVLIGQAAADLLSKGEPGG
ncbi:MAG: serine hydrolase [Planctomycetota bacterium]